MKRGSRSAQFSMTNVRITGQGQTWHIQVLHEATLEGVSFDEAVEASKEMEKAKATVTVGPGQPHTQALDTETVQEPGDALLFGPGRVPNANAEELRKRLKPIPRKGE